jgi:translation elongation factor EF-Tu-like GTPase
MEKQIVVNSAAAATADKRRESFILRTQIGSTTYVVNVHFSEKSAETMNGKIIKLVESEVRKLA